VRSCSASNVSSFRPEMSASAVTTLGTRLPCSKWQRKPASTPVAWAAFRKDSSRRSRALRRDSATSGSRCRRGSCCPRGPSIGTLSVGRASFGGVVSSRCPSTREKWRCPLPLSLTMPFSSRVTPLLPQPAPP
jgi:hypothetical protein